MGIFLPDYTIPNVGSWLNQPRQQFGPIGTGLPQQMGSVLGTGTPAPAPNPAPQPFVWGANGQMTDPSQRAAQVDTSPIGHWTQGAARMGQAYADALQRRQQQFPSVPGGGSLNLASRFGFNNGGLY